MTASLYQSAVSGSAGCASATATSWLFSRNTEDVRRERMRIQLHKIAPPAPGVVAGGDEIVQLVSVAWRAVEIHPARLHITRVQVHHDEDEIVPGLLGVADELVIVRRMEAQAPVALQRRVLAPHLIQPCDERPQALGPLTVPALDLVLLGVEVLLTAWLARRILHQLERGPIHAVVRRERRGEHQPRDERRSPAVLQILVQDVRRIRPDVRPEIFARGMLRQLGEILRELPARVAPREVRIRLREA